MQPRKRVLLIFVGLALVTVFLDQGRRVWREHSQDQNILAAAGRYGADPALVKAVIWRESRFDPHARGGKGEIGLMQIMPRTGQEWALAQRVTNYADRVLLEPARNIECGTWYLQKALARYTQTDDPVPYALSDYNAGHGNVIKWITGPAATNSALFIDQIRFPSTRRYVRSIMQRRARYRRWADSARAEPQPQRAGGGF